ncbi:MAG: helix-turn-helix domain-containing protein [Verrucomicrobiota bacterium]
MKASSMSASPAVTEYDFSPTCGCRSIRSSVLLPHHPCIELNLTKSGLVRYLYSGEEIRLGAGRLAVFWAAMPHQIIESSSNSEIYSLTLPLKWFLQFQMPEDFTRQILGGQVLVEPESGSPGDYEMFNRWIEDLAAASPWRERVLMLEIEARLLRFANRLAAYPEGEPFIPRPAHRSDPNSVDRVRRIISFIAQNYTDEITMELIGKSAGLDPNHAMGLFRKTVGTTLIHYVTRHRLSHAQHLLATTDSKVVDVAMLSGFNSLSRFNDVFKRECGCSPREYRNRSLPVGLN